MKSFLVYLSICCCFISLIEADLPVEHLVPPHIGESYIKERITCIRPARKGCFNISWEMKDDKLIVHDYGQGGAGYALLPGSINLSLEKFEQALQGYPQFKNQEICVIGAGCIGLYTALKLAEKGYKVCVIAKAFDHLASNNAAGSSWFMAVDVSENMKAVADRVLFDSWQTYSETISREYSLLPLHSSRFISVYCSEDNGATFDFYVKKGLIPSAEKVMIDFGNEKRYTVLKYRPLFLDTSLIFKSLQEKILAQGIAIKNEEILTFAQVPQKIVFNCTGIGAANLNHDEQMQPIQGHLIALKNQPPIHDLQYMIYATVEQDNKSAFVLYSPKDEGFLGGTFIEGESGLDTNQQEFDLLMKRAKDYFGN